MVEQGALVGLVVVEPAVQPARVPHVFPPQQHRLVPRAPVDVQLAQGRLLGPEAAPVR